MAVDVEQRGLYVPEEIPAICDPAELKAMSQMSYNDLAFKVFEREPVACLAERHMNCRCARLEIHSWSRIFGSAG